MKFLRKNKPQKLSGSSERLSVSRGHPAYRAIADSGVFDAKYYLHTYSDVAQAGLDPLEHYLAFGAAEMRNPNANFDAVYYVALVSGWKAGFNPLIHYLEVGRGLALRTKRGTPPDTYDIIAESGLFDFEFYLTRYPDVRKSKNDPLRHFIRHGARELRQPNHLFDARHYCAIAKIDASKVNPLLHYISEGETLGLSPHAAFSPRKYLERHGDVARAGVSPLAHYLRHGVREGRHIEANAPVDAEPSAFPDLRELSVTIVIPIYNGGDHVRRCIDSVLENTSLRDVRLLLIDDASTDPKTKAILRRYAEQVPEPTLTLVTNEANLGFTRTVNRGFLLTPGRDVVILNSDTIVSPRWLESLGLACYRDRKTATATALSDSAGVFSTPHAAVNHTSGMCDVATAARLSRRAADRVSTSIPTGHGFCMYVRRTAISEIGGLDEAHFPTGYGEENDFCLRATELGWSHALALKAYVHHVNAISFGATKQRRVADARTMLDRLHPGYGHVLKTQLDLPALATQRARFRDLLATKDLDGVKPRILFVLSTRTGGTPLTNADLMGGISDLYEPLLLHCDREKLTLSEFTEGGLRPIAEHSLTRRVDLATHGSHEYDRVVEGWLVEFDIELVHIRHIAWHSLQLPLIAQRLGIPVIKSFHDFYCVCPSVNLTDGLTRWDPTGYKGDTLAVPLWPQEMAQLAPGTTAATLLPAWRRKMNAMLRHCDAFVTTADFAKGLIRENLSLPDRPFEVIPHGRDFAHLAQATTQPTSGTPLRVLVPGNISPSKGLLVFSELLRRMGRRLELHVLGTASQEALPGAVFHGPYSRDDFVDRVAAIKPHIAAILSIWPETYCHTLTECWAAGVPVVGSSFGAVAERIEAAGAGWLVDPFDEASVISLLERIQADQADWSQKARAVVEWQRTTGRARTVFAMSADYLALYETVRTQRRMRPSQTRSVAVVARGAFPNSPPSVHVRMGQVHNSSVYDYRWMTADALLRRGIRNFDSLLVCRNVFTSSQTVRLCQQLQDSPRPVIVDLDDDLLNVPPEKDRTGEHGLSKVDMERLLGAASLVTASTSALSDRLVGRASQVVVLQNTLLPDLWSVPVEHGHVPPELTPTDQLRILYFGSHTHGEDFALVREALAKTCKAYRGTIYLIGIGDAEGAEFVRIRPPSTRYDQFVPWLRSIAHNFDIAIAPLVSSSFNETKSPLKFMEYSALGLPSICSKVRPYQGFVREGVDGLLVDNSVAAWTSALKQLAGSAARRRELAESASARCRAEFFSSECRFDPLLAAIRGVRSPAKGGDFER